MSNEYFSSSWQGIALAPSSTGEFKIGAFSSTGDNKFALSATLTKALDVCADDGGTALAAASIRTIRSRMLIRTAISGSPDLSVYGLQGQLKVGAVTITTSAHMAGLWGYLETVSSSNITGNYAGVLAMADLPTGATLASGANLSGLLIASQDLSGTSTGDMSAIYVEAPLAGTWDYFAKFAASTGCTDAIARTMTGVGSLKIKINDSIVYIPFVAGT